MKSEFEMHSRIGERSERGSGNLVTVAGDGIGFVDTFSAVFYYLFLKFL